MLNIHLKFCYHCYYYHHHYYEDHHCLYHFFKFRMTRGCTFDGILISFTLEYFIIIIKFRLSTCYTFLWRIVTTVIIINLVAVLIIIMCIIFFNSNWLRDTLFWKISLHSVSNYQMLISYFLIFILVLTTKYKYRL